MHFVFIAIGIFSSESVTGGDTILIELAERLMRRGDRVTLLTSKSGAVMFRREGLEADSWTITGAASASETSVVRAVLALPVRMLRAAMLLRGKNLGEGAILVPASDLIFDIFPVLFVRDRQVKRILPFHQIMPNPFKGYRGIFTNRLKLPNIRETLAYLQQRLSLHCLKHASDLVFPLSNLKQFLLAKGVPAEKIVGFSPGLDFATIDRVATPEKKYDACWMGRYHTMKGCDDLINIWELVCRERKGAKLALMGSAARKLEPMIARRHLKDNVEVLGFVDDATKFRTMKQSRMLLFPSYYESWGMIISEAMACGLPAVTYDLPVYEDIYPRGRVKVAIGDMKAFAAAAVRLLEDDETRKRLGKEAREVASLYRWERVAENFMVGVEKITKSGHQTPGRSEHGY
jgi:glycosyltransferase involved in cell wall biosynthesis